MIVSPRAEIVTDILRKEGNGFIKIDEVFLYRRAGAGAPYRKVPYWRRSEDSATPPPPKFTSFAIVPEMTAAIYRGSGIHANTANAWRAFDRSVQTSGALGASAIVSFPTPRFVRGWAINFEWQWSRFWMAIEGRMQNGMWTPLFEASENPVGSGRYGTLTTPMFCSAVRVLTDSPSPVRSCQLFDAVPLLPVSMTSNTAAGVRVLSDPANWNLFRCFTEQANAYTHGTATWYFNNGEWQSNRGLPSTRRQNRFEVHLDEPKTVGGFSVGGFHSTDYYSHYGSWEQNCYANCLLIEGRGSSADYWLPLAEVEFTPAERRTRYFDFPINRSASQLRITVQDVTRGATVRNSTPVFLPPMQIWEV